MAKTWLIAYDDKAIKNQDLNVSFARYEDTAKGIFAGFCETMSKEDVSNIRLIEVDTQTLVTRLLLKER